MESVNTSFITLFWISGMSDEDESVIGELPPPRETDVLFGSAVDWQNDACIGQWDSDAAYTIGFRRAGLRLAEHVCATARDQDVLVYPIVYLYRHHIELILKGIVAVAFRLLDRELTEHEQQTLGGHDLARLWGVTRPLLNPVCALVPNSPFPDDDMRGIDSYIRQLHEHDPDGQRFRYASTKPRRSGRRGFTAGGPSLNPNLTHVNIRAFAAAMEQLAEYLENIEWWFGDLEDAKAEWQQKYGY
jgi:hypothetical protein